MLERFFKIRGKENPNYDVSIKQRATASASNMPSFEWAYTTGEKFAGGLSNPEIQILDYEALKTYSQSLFNENLYASGAIKAIVNDVLGKGLDLEANPLKSLIDFETKEASKWASKVEDYFLLWSTDEKRFDYAKNVKFKEMQKQAYREILISGDVLLKIYNEKGKTRPSVELIPSTNICSPLGYEKPEGNYIIEGIEFNSRGEEVAYHVIRNDNGTLYERIPKFGSNSKRRIGIFIKAEGGLPDDARGRPLLMRVIQSLSEIDKYRDSAQRKAFINSLFALFVEREKPTKGNGSLDFDDDDDDDAEGTASVVQPPDASEVNKGYFLDAVKVRPGVVGDKLEPGEKVQGFKPDGTDLNFTDFENTIIRAIAWSLRIPPSILTLSMSSNYSASSAELSKWFDFARNQGQYFGDNLCQPIYEEFLISCVLNNDIEASNFLKGFLNEIEYIDEYRAWCYADWQGPAHQTADVLKTTKAAVELIKNNLSSYTDQTRALTGKRFSKVMEQKHEDLDEIIKYQQRVIEFKEKYGTNPEDVMESL